jgi:hypothetical protein
MGRLTSNFDYSIWQQDGSMTALASRAHTKSLGEEDLAMMSRHETATRVERSDL